MSSSGLLTEKNIQPDTDSRSLSEAYGETMAALMPRDPNRIKVSFSAKTATEEKNGGGIVKKESSQNYVKILPVPADAVPGSGKVKTEVEQVKIIFETKRTK